MSAPTRERVSSIAVLQAVLASASEVSIAAQLHVSIRTLRRFADGSVKMNWVTHTRLEGVAAELESKQAAEREEREAAQRERSRTSRKRDHASGSYTRVEPPAVALLTSA